MATKIPTVLVILDGYGVAPPSRGNAITLAKKPTIDRLFQIYPSTTLCAHGDCVGLEAKKVSGSEAGHMNIGAGRIVKQDSRYITESIKDGSFFLNPAIVGAIKHLNKSGGNLHVMGLMGTTDSPHADPKHFQAILKLAKREGLSQVYCHLFTDGRDSYPQSALDHLKSFRKILDEERIGKIASLCGRFYAMDRAKNWKRLTKAYDAMVFARGEFADSAEEAIQKAYEQKLTDEFVLPTYIKENGQPITRIGENDAIIFFNFRSDRARQFSKLFIAFDKKSILEDDMPIIDKIKNLYFVALTDFGPGLAEHTAFPEHRIDATLPMALGHLKQLYIAESEKFAHVTYFLNGGYADPVSAEERVMVKSPVVDSYMQAPEMSADEITRVVVGNIENNVYDFMTINYANADMVGHTGNIKATIKAIETLDRQIAILEKEILGRGGNLIITADHGNADDMIDFKTDQPNTFHTKNPVPFIIVSEKFKNRKVKKGVLGNIAPTILDILGVKKPKAMKEDSLLG